MDKNNVLKLLRAFVDGDKIDNINGPILDMFLKVYGLTIDDVRKISPVIGHRYDKTYRFEALEELYNEFPSNNKNAISSSFTESGYDYIATRNILISIGPTMRKPRITSTTAPTNFYLREELKFVKNVPKPEPAKPAPKPEPAKHAPKPEPPPVNTTSDQDEAAAPLHERRPVSYAEFINSCKILEVSPDASKSDIKEAFKKLALKTHPDKTTDTNKFQQIKNAYDLANRFFTSS